MLLECSTASTKYLRSTVHFPVQRGHFTWTFDRQSGFLDIPDPLGRKENAVLLLYVENLKLNNISTVSFTFPFGGLNNADYLRIVSIPNIKSSAENIP